MTIQLDHYTVASRNRVAAARLLATILDVSWSDAGVGPFSPVYVNEGLTLDFDEFAGPFPVQHYCFRVDPAGFDAIVSRLASLGIPYRSAVRGPVDMQAGTYDGGRIIYWNEPDGHQWEALTVSYAREPK